MTDISFFIFFRKYSKLERKQVFFTTYTSFDVA